MTEAAQNPNQTNASNPAGQAAAISPELVQQVAERVYARLVMELKIERERSPKVRGVKRYGN